MKTLPYAEARPLVQDGDTLYCQGTSLFSRAIRRFTGEMSHVGKIHILGPRRMVFESKEGTGTRIVPLSWYAANYKGRLFVGRPVGLDRALTLTWCLDHTMIDYDWTEIFRIALRRFRISRRTRVVENEDRICSEFVADADEAGGVVHPYNAKGYVTPTDIWNSPKVDRLWEIGG